MLIWCSMRRVEFFGKHYNTCKRHNVNKCLWGMFFFQRFPSRKYQCPFDDESINQSNEWSSTGHPTNQHINNVLLFLSHSLSLFALIYLFVWPRWTCCLKCGNCDFNGMHRYQLHVMLTTPFSTLRIAYALQYAVCVVIASPLSISKVNLIDKLNFVANNLQSFEHESRSKSIGVWMEADTKWNILCLCVCVCLRVTAPN